MNQFLVVVQLHIKDQNDKENIFKEIKVRLSKKNFLAKVMGKDLIDYDLPIGTFIIQTDKNKNVVYKEVYNCCFEVLSLVFHDHIKTKFSFIMANIHNSLQWFRLDKS